MEGSAPNKYSLFGYFKLDRLRHIWFVFSSLKLTHELTVFVDCERPLTLTLLNPFNNLLKRLIKVSPRMRTLESLRVRFCNGEDVASDLRDAVEGEGRNLFSVPNCFPNLRHFDYESDFNMPRQYIFLQDWKVAEPNFFKKIRSLRIEIYNWEDTNAHNVTLNNVENIFQKIGKNLQRLVLHDIYLPETVTIHLPNLEFLNINCCSNILFDLGSNLKNLRWETEESMTEEIVADQNKNMEAIYRISTKLKSIEFVLFGTPSLNLESWLLVPIANPLQHLESLAIYSSHDVNADYLKSSSCFGKKLEFLILYVQNAEYDEEVFSREYPTLKIMRLGKPPKVTKRWRIMDHVEDLCLKDSDNLSDDFFNLNEFKKLERLIIRRVPKIKGCLKNEMGRVRFFGGNDLNISDVMFQVAFGASLRKLMLKDCHTLRGQNWRSEAMSGLEELEIVKCKNFLDDLFLQNEFKRLRTLKLVESRHITGENWNALPELESLTIMQAPLLSIDLFTTGKLEKLKFLNIGRKRSLLVEGVFTCIGFGDRLELLQWRTPSLVEFRTNDRESFCPGFLEGRGSSVNLPVNCKVIVDDK